MGRWLELLEEKLGGFGEELVTKIGFLFSLVLDPCSILSLKGNLTLISLVPFYFFAFKVLFKFDFEFSYGFHCFLHCAMCFY